MDEMKKFLDLLEENGFKIMRSNKPKQYNYAYFSKDDKIGYVQFNVFKGFSFSTVHKPNRKTGTGYQVIESTWEPTIEDAEKSFCLVPEWALSSDISSVVKYKNWDSFVALKKKQHLV